MTVATGLALGATGLARNWRLEVDTSTTGAATWVRVMGITDMTPNPGTVATEDDADYDAGGYGSTNSVGLDWGVTCTVRRAAQRAVPDEYDAGQEFLRIKGKKTGTLNTAHVRFYEYDPDDATAPQVEAYEGYAAVSWANGGGGPRANRTATITLTGQGKLLDIAHPAAA